LRDALDRTAKIAKPFAAASEHGNDEHAPLVAHPVQDLSNGEASVVRNVGVLW
jgi:hypothetical protein